MGSAPKWLLYDTQPWILLVALNLDLPFCEPVWRHCILTHNTMSNDGLMTYQFRLWTFLFKVNREQGESIDLSPETECCKTQV